MPDRKSRAKAKEFTAEVKSTRKRLKRVLAHLAGADGRAVFAGLTTARQDGLLSRGLAIGGEAGMLKAEFETLYALDGHRRHKPA